MGYAPCKDCTERQVGCHGDCPKYAAFRYQKQAHSGGSAKRNARKCIRRKGGVSAAEEKKMKRFFLVGTIDDILAVLKALGEMNTFKTHRLYDVL